MDYEPQIFLRCDFFFQSDYVKSFAPIKRQRRGIRSFFKLTRQYSHTNQIAAMNAFKALRDDSLDAEKLCSLCCPIARTSSAILLPGNDHERYPFRLVLHRGIVNTHAFAIRLMAVNSDTALDARHHQV